MLAGIRNVTRGWIAGILLSILAVSFAIWGIEDVFRPTAANAVASGGGVSVGAEEFRKQFDSALEQAREQQGRPITRQEAADAGLAQQVLNDMIGTRAVDRLAEKIGFVASNEMVAEAVRSQDAFRNQITGAFDRNQYRTLLARNALTEQEFENDVRAGLARRELAATVLAGMHTPQSLAKMIYAFETERRIISMAAITPERAGKVREPTEADLKAFYEERKSNFEVPELRTVTVVKARPDAFISKVETPEDKIRQLYEFRKPSLSGGEKRSFVQISTPDQATANEAARRLAAGEDADKIAAALKAQAIPFALVEKKDVPDAAVGEAVFALSKGQSSGAIKGKLAWSAAREIDIAGGGGAPSYESVRDTLRAELQKQEAQNLLNDAVNNFDQQRAAGKSLEEAAKGAGLEVHAVERMNAQGATDRGGPAAVFANAPELLRAAFLAPLNEPTDFSATPDGGYALVRVNEIVPAGVRPYEEVKAILPSAWKATESGKAMRAISDDVAKAVTAGKSFAAAVKEHKLVLAATSQPVDRRAAQSSAIPLLVRAVFSASKGDVVAAPDVNGPVLLLAQVEDVLRQEPSRNPQLFAQARVAAEKMASEDFLFALQNAALKSTSIKTNEKLLNSTLGVEASSGDAQAAK